MLSDELEYGLELHRIARFLGSLGAKEAAAPLQVFLTTHSPVALRELSGGQLFVLRRGPLGLRLAWSVPTMTSRARSASTPRPSWLAPWSCAREPAR